MSDSCRHRLAFNLRQWCTPQIVPELVYFVVSVAKVNVNPIAHHTTLSVDHWFASQL